MLKESNKMVKGGKQIAEEKLSKSSKEVKNMMKGRQNFKFIVETSLKSK